jgi:hypothetical protein
MGSEAEDKISSRRQRNLQRGYVSLLILCALFVSGIAAFHFLWGWHHLIQFTTPSVRVGNVALYLCASGETHLDSACHPVGLDVAHGLADLKNIAAERHSCIATDDADISTECRFFDQDGLEITKDADLSLLTNGTRLAVVKGDNHFFWPTVKIGHRWRPKHVVSPIPDKPIEMETLSESPRVFLIDNFLTEEEITYLVEHAQGRLERSHVGIGKETFHNQRTSKTAWDTGSKISMGIQHRGYDLVRMPWDKSTTDAVQVIRYEKGQMYLLHTDYFKVGYANLDSSQPGGTNRIVTIFMYLSDVDAGGGTLFPHSKHHGEVQDDRVILNPPANLEKEIHEENKKMAQCNLADALQVHPKRGRAILFYNQLPDGTLDIKAEHGGCPVAEGHKWAANVWIWNRKRPRFGSGGKQIKRSSGKGWGSWLWGSKSKHTTHAESLELKIEFSNERSTAVEVFWVKPDATEQRFGVIGPNGKLPMNTFSGHTWVIRDAATHKKIKAVTMKVDQTAISIL